jgi:hypothetical protein
MSRSEVDCASCGKTLSRGVVVGGAHGRESHWKCVRCALFDRALVGRSSRVAVLVGTILVALNQGDQLLMGSFPFETSWWKIPMTYLVPYCVATYGAISNGYRPVARAGGAPSVADA